MHTLLLQRHALTANGQPGQHDAARPLTAAGVAQACAAGQWLQQAGQQPSLIVHSPAARTQATAVQVAAELTPKPVLQAEPAVYEASPGELLAILQRLAAQPVLHLIGHNPGVQGLLAVLLGVPGMAAPTMQPACLACLGLGGDWPEPGRARLLGFHAF